MKHNMLVIFFGVATLALGAPQSFSGESENPVDYAALSVAGGIDVYSITATGATLLKGSPFVPNPVPQSSPGVSQPAPVAVLINQHQRRLLAVYASEPTTNVRYTLWSFKLSTKGLEQESSIALGVGGFSEHTPVSTGYGTTNHYFFYSVPSPEGLPAFEWYLFETRAGVITPAGSIGVEVEAPSGGTIPSFVTLDTNEHFAYVCTPTIAPQASVYSVNNAAVTFDFTSVDPGFVQAKCGS